MSIVSIAYIKNELNFSVVPPNAPLKGIIEKIIPFTPQEVWNTLHSNGYAGLCLRIVTPVFPLENPFFEGAEFRVVDSEQYQQNSIFVGNKDTELLIYSITNFFSRLCKFLFPKLSLLNPLHAWKNQILDTFDFPNEIKVVELEWPIISTLEETFLTAPWLAGPVLPPYAHDPQQSVVGNMTSYTMKCLVRKMNELFKRHSPCKKLQYLPPKSSHELEQIGFYVESHFKMVTRTLSPEIQRAFSKEEKSTTMIVNRNLKVLSPSNEGHILKFLQFGRIEGYLNKWMDLNDVSTLEVYGSLSNQAFAKFGKTTAVLLPQQGINTDTWAFPALIYTLEILNIQGKVQGDTFEELQGKLSGPAREMCLDLFHDLSSQGSELPIAQFQEAITSLKSGS